MVCRPGRWLTIVWVVVLDCRLQPDRGKLAIIGTVLCRHHPFDQIPSQLLTQRLVSLWTSSTMEQGEGVRNRRLYLCPETTSRPVQDLIRECPRCGGFVFYCCACNNQSLYDLRNEPTPISCHHFRIIFTDGACKNNGKLTAKSGIRIAYSSNTAGQLSIAITDMLDNFAVRSNQRAELLAAIIGLRTLSSTFTRKNKKEQRSWIVAPDSAYVVKGITKWLRTWRVCIFQQSARSRERESCD